jgi:Histidine kinase-like ATPase domain
MKQAERVTGTRPASAPWPVSSIMPPLGALRTAPSTARARVRAVLATWRMGDLAVDLELVVSELVTNSVNASAGGRMSVIQLCLRTDGTRLLAEVWDQAPGAPVLLSAGQDDESGRGLALVDTITGSCWGWHPARPGPGKCVCAEFTTPGAAARDGSQRGTARHTERRNQ